MFKITDISDGRSIGMTEAPTYIKQHENGCFVLCPEPEAQGISFEGIVYHIMGRPDLEGAVGTVTLEPMDAGAIVAAMQLSGADADAMNVDQELRLTMLELGFTDSTGGTV